MDTDFDEALDFMPMLDVLDLVKIKKGYVLNFYKTDMWEYHTIPYIRKEFGEKKETGCRCLREQPDPEEQRVFQYLEIPFTEMGVWQGYLLHILPGITPKGGHANYHAVEEVYGYEELLSCIFRSQGYNEAGNNRELEEIIERYNDEFMFDRPNPELLASLYNLLGIESFLPKAVINSEDSAIIESLFFSNFGGLVYEVTKAIRIGNTLKYEPQDQRVLVKYDCGICY